MHMGTYVFFYLFCQALVLAIFYYKIPSLKQYTKPIPIAFYISTILSLISYFIVSSTQPGYLLSQETASSKIQDTRPTPMLQDFDQTKRYCLACHHQQPYRVKHCTLCHKCVRGFDHHCPLVDNCIGEKNKPHFLCFLTIQNIQIVLSILLVEKNLSFRDRDLAILTLFILLLIFASALGVLLLFHLYLMFKNILTWQFFSWDSIDYLDDYKPGSNPFDLGTWMNLKLYWTYGCCRKDFYQWKIEKKQIHKEPYP